MVLWLTLPAFVFLSGCGPSTAPEAIWCETGQDAGQVVYPRGITYDKTSDSFFVVDRAARVQHLDRSGKYINGWQMPEQKQGKPVGISVAPDGSVYVPDTHYHRIIVYSADGKELKRFGSRGTGPGQFTYPTDIAFDSKGRIFISEYGDHDRVQVFDANANYLYEFGTFGTAEKQFSRPQSMVIDGDTIYIADACNHRISVWKTDGTFLRIMGSVGSAPGQYRYPYGIDLDEKGRLVVCEFGNNRVQLIDKNTGKGLEIWGQVGREPGQLAYPWAAVVDKHGRVVAVDAGNNRFQVFEF